MRTLPKMRDINKLTMRNKKLKGMLYKASLYLTVLFLLFGNDVFAQKPLIDTNVYHKWPSVENARITSDGKYVLYSIKNEPVGGGTVVFVSTDRKWEMKIPSARNPSFSADGRKGFYLLPGDSLAIVSLREGKTEYIQHVKFYSGLKNGVGRYLLYQTDLPTHDVVIRNLASGDNQSIPGALNYGLNDQGTVAVVFAKDPGIDLNRLEWVDLVNSRSKTIWKGGAYSQYSFAKNEDKLAFIAKENADAGPYSLWQYEPDSAMAHMVARGGAGSIRKGFSLCNDNPVFSEDGSKLFFTIQNDSIASLKISDKPGVDIWNYRDKHLQSEQFSGYASPRSKVAMVFNQRTGGLYALSGYTDNFDVREEKKGHFLLTTESFFFEDEYYNKSDRPSLYLVSAEDGTRVLLYKQLRSDYPASLSANGNFAVWFNNDSLAYFSYDVKTGKTVNLSRTVLSFLYDDDEAKKGHINIWEIAGWSKDDRHVFLYDRYDIWKVDLAGKEKAVNITRQTGRASRIAFSIVPNKSAKGYIDEGSFILLAGFNTRTKANGFWQLPSDLQGPPVEKIMSDDTYFIAGRTGRTGFVQNASLRGPEKALNADIYLVWRMNEKESPNIFVTRDFKNYQPISHVYPEKNYNWLTAELVTWKTKDGQLLQGILYKPENFDLARKYPVIFNYYEQRSDALHRYNQPDFAVAEIDIATFVSRGYLVFLPDLYFGPGGNNGAGLVSSIESAARYLAKRPYVDAAKLGLQGHSFGGWETNYLITHSRLFAAASEGAGVSNIISAYGQIYKSIGNSAFRGYYEVGHSAVGSTYGLGNTPWIKPDVYIRDSPVFYVNRITTPLLILHNKNDGAVDFDQGIEMFTDMQRAGKKVWLLQYDNEGHGLNDHENEKDYTIRQLQFFDHYLKGAAAPKWMVEGIPAVMKNKDKGYELMPGMEP